MSEMIERVALALRPKCVAFGQGETPMLVAREFARAAIEAMMEPTEAMIEANETSDLHAASISESCWRVMIAAALE